MATRHVLRFALIALCALVPTVRGLGRRQVDSNPRASYETASASRELVAKHHRIYFSEATRTGDTGSTLIVYGYAQFTGAREEWARVWGEPGDGFDQHLKTPSQGYAQALQGTEPTYEILGDGRSIVLGRRKGHDWKGVLLDTEQRSARGGALALGLLLRERWMNAAIARAMDCEAEASSLCYRFGPEPGDDDVVIRTDEERPVQIEWIRTGESKFLYQVTTWVEVEGVQLPAAGTQQHRYGPGGQTEVVLEYAPIPEGEPTELLALPSRLAKAGLIVPLKNAASGQVIELGPSGLVTPLEQRPPGADAETTPSPEEPSSWLPLILGIALATGVGSTILLMRSRRR